MQTIKSFVFTILLGISAAGLITASAHATVVLQLSGNQLTGATGVEVDGAVYDVVFVDGTCAAVFGSCDQNTQFLFDTAAAAQAAGEALLGQVFVDGPLGQFDSIPSLTSGCSHGIICSARIPQFANDFLVNGMVAGNFNASFNDFDEVGPFGLDRLENTSLIIFEVWAVFTAKEAAAVPAPPALSLFAAGLVGLAAVRRRRLGLISFRQR
ncbi:MAG: hypothetical protein GKS00_25695 [Alphaproteobacteria bacterium]|nr:hypothetical protein [Alphaproteobacteria bacterium]